MLAASSSTPTSIHAPPRGGRPVFMATSAPWTAFQSTPPREGGDAIRARPPHGQDNDFNPRPPARGATGTSDDASNYDLIISIHAPPRGGRRHRQNITSQGLEFQSTPPREGGDHKQHRIIYIVKISIHAPPRGGRLQFDISKILQRIISIHAPPRGGRRDDFILLPPYHQGFQSTPPREGGDSLSGGSIIRHHNFNPRPPARGATAAC